MQIRRTWFDLSNRVSASNATDCATILRLVVQYSPAEHNSASLWGMLGRMTRLCPMCRKPVDSETDAEFPFCSERCRLIDLGNWSSEQYKISEPVIDESMPDEPPHSEHDGK
ncbi:MAG TPA: DNA gyrase inhibitor YacG [Candidatus Acidoferrales bacterium]|nr:DNA gyrase inhibitor YacG [Candidatus Acidoferrales bacterium]